MAHSISLREALDRTSGTVTDFLEHLVGETIVAHTHRQGMFEASTADGIEAERGEPLLHRSASLRGRTSGCSYVYAESVIAVGRLPGEFYHQLETSSDTIGRVLDDLGIVTTRTAIGDVDASVSPGVSSDIGIDACLLARAYRIDVENTPVMIISEWFLQTLSGFISLA